MLGDFAVQNGKLAYTVQEVASLTQTHKNHIYRMVQRGELRAIRLGNALRVPTTELERLGLLPTEKPAQRGG